MTWLLSLLSGILFGASLPPNPFGWVEWVAFVPLILAVRRSGPIKAFLLGALCVLAASLLLIFPIRSPEELGNGGGGAAVTALLIGWTCAFAAALKGASPWRGTLGIAAAGVCGEWLGFIVFPMHVALGQWKNLFVMPVASWVGVWGISFLIYAVNASLAVVLESVVSGRRTDSPIRFRSRPSIRAATGVLLFTIGVHLVGWTGTSSPQEGDRLRVAALQPDDSDALSLLRQARARGARVAVWPELSLDEPLDRDLKKYAVPGLYQVIGYGGFPPEEGMPENFAAMVSPDRKILGRYSKIHLFGTERDAHRAGSSLTVAPGPLGKSGLAICYDTMYTDVVRELTRRGARAVYVPNYDPGSHRGALHAMHAAATVFRAAENGVPIVRSEWRGYSMIIDGRGRVLRNAGMASPTVLVADVALPRRPGTLYTRLGDLFPVLCAGALLLLIVMEVRSEARLETRREDAFRQEWSDETEDRVKI